MAFSSLSMGQRKPCQPAELFHPFGKDIPNVPERIGTTSFGMLNSRSSVSVKFNVLANTFSHAHANNVPSHPVESISGGRRKEENFWIATGRCQVSHLDSISP